MAVLLAPPALFAKALAPTAVLPPASVWDAGVSAPEGPVAPVGPAGPWGPATVESAPFAPAGPCGPVAPVSPCGPIAPAGILAISVSSFSKLWLKSSALTTSPLLNSIKSPATEWQQVISDRAANNLLISSLLGSHQKHHCPQQDREGDGCPKGHKGNG